VLICDSHIHVGRYYRLTNPETFDRSDFYYEPRVIAETLKCCGVDEFIFSSISCQRHVSIADIEREACETQAAFGPGAHPFYWVTGPFYDDDPDFKILDNGLFEGVKIHELETPWVKERPKDLDRILSVLEERDVPVQFHAGEDAGCFPHELLPFAKRHPNLRIDFAHCRPYKEMIECLKECPNLFTDTAFMLPEHYSELVAAGVERQVLFGTDLPIQAGFYAWAEDDVGKALEHFYRKELGAVQATGYSKDVMSLNFKRYLGI
jgi:hypothetical protein